MSPILDNEPRLRELIRLRMGKKVPAKKKGETKPEAIDTWRLTCPLEEPLTRAGELWGGEVQPFEEPTSADRFQIVTETAILPCVIPPVSGFSQWYELWSGGGCQRRCDGHRDHISDGPCLCSEDPAERECKPTTRLTVILHDLGAYVGARLESHGYYASVELAVAEALYSAARARRTMIPAQLRLASRTVKRPGQPPNHFVVPELLFSMAPAMEALGMAGVPAEQLQRTTERAALPPADPTFGRPAPPLEVGPPSPEAPETPPPADHGAKANEAAEKKQAWIDSMVKRARGLGLDVSDIGIVVNLLTEARTNNLAHLAPHEQMQFSVVLQLIADGKVEVDSKAEGGPRFVDADMASVLLHFDSEGVVSIEPAGDHVNWRALARNAGLTTGALLRRAREIAGEIDVDVPKDMGEISDEDLCARLQTWVAEEKAKRDEKAKAPA